MQYFLGAKSQLGPTGPTHSRSLSEGKRVRGSARVINGVFVFYSIHWSIEYGQQTV